MSPCKIKLLSGDEISDAPYEADSLEEAARHEPKDGVYTVTRTYNTFQVLNFDAHLDRLEDSARQNNLTLKLYRPALRAALHQIIEVTSYGDVRFRITVSRQKPDLFIISMEPFKPLPSYISSGGVRCMTLPGASRDNPVAKTTDWMHARRTITLPEGVYDGFLLDADANLLEGLGSNFYAIRNGELYTAGSGVLPGTAQKIVFEVAPAILPVNKTPVNVRDLSLLGEAFLTSSSRGIIPIIEIDGITIGNGTRGPFCEQLQTAYNAWAEAHLEDL